MNPVYHKNYRNQKTQKIHVSGVKRTHGFFTVGMAPCRCRFWFRRLSCSGTILGDTTAAEPFQSHPSSILLFSGICSFYIAGSTEIIHAYIIIFGKNQHAVERDSCLPQFIIRIGLLTNIQEVCHICLRQIPILS